MSSQAFAEGRTLQGVRQARELFRTPDQLARLARHHHKPGRGLADPARW